MRPTPEQLKEALDWAAKYPGNHIHHEHARVFEAEVRALQAELSQARGKAYECTHEVVSPLSSRGCYNCVLTKLEKAEIELEAATQLWHDAQNACAKHARRGDALEADVAELRLDLGNILGIIHDHGENLHTDDSEDACIRSAWQALRGDDGA